MKGAVTFAFAHLPFSLTVFLLPSPRSCGPAGVQFSVKADYGQHTVGRPEPGKALAYVLERFQDLPANAITPTVRVGLNGAWVGANRGLPYLVFSVDPGEHHLCASWQSPSEIHLKSVLLDHVLCPKRQSLLLRNRAAGRGGPLGRRRMEERFGSGEFG